MPPSAQTRTLSDAELLALFDDPRADLQLLAPDEQQRLLTLTDRSTPAPQQAPQGMLESVFQGIGETLIPKWRDIKELGGGLLTDPLGTLGAVGQGIVGGMGEQFGHVGRLAQEAVQAPLGSADQMANLLEIPGRALAGSLPIVGPAAAAAGELIGGEEPARGVGQGLGLIGPQMVGSLLSKIRPAKPVGPVPMTRGERTGAKLPQFAEAVTEKTIPGSGQFRQFRETQQTALIDDLAEGAVQRISTFQGSPEQLGQLVTSEIQKAQEAFKTQARGLYAQIDEMTQSTTRRVPETRDVPSSIVGPRGEPLTVPKRTLTPVQVGGVQPSTIGLKQFAVPLLRRIRQESQLIPPGELQQTVSKLEQIINAPKRLPFQTFQDARSDLLAIARSRGIDPIPGKAGGVAKKLAGITDEALETAARDSGLPGLEDMLRQANETWRRGVETFNDSVLRKMIDQAPEKIHLLLAKADLDDIATLRATVPPEAFQAIKSTYLRDILARDIKGEALPALGGSELLPNMQSSQIRTLSGGTLRRELEDLHRFGKLDAIFSSTESKQLLEVAGLAERLAKGRGQNVAGLIAGMINMSIVSSPWALFTGNLDVLAGVAGTAAGLNLAARVLTNPKGLTAVRGLLHAVGQGAAPSITFWSARVGELARHLESTQEPEP